MYVFPHQPSTISSGNILFINNFFMLSLNCDKFFFLKESFDIANSIGYPIIAMT